MNRIMIDIGNAKGLIFDCDGTLVDSMPMHMKAWKYAFDKVGADYHYDYLYSKKGMKELEIIKHYNENFNTNLDPDEIVKIKHDYFIKHIKSLKSIQPVEDVVHTYYGKLPMGVVSGSVKEIVHKELEVIGLKNKFEYILTADDPIKPKPAPDKFLKAARMMDIAPKDCLVFEDGDSGIAAAKAAGMMVFDVRKPDEQTKGILN